MKANRLIIRIMCAVMMIGALTLGTGCSSHRKAQSISGQPSRVVAKRSSEVGQLADTYSKWSDVYMPFSMRCASPMSISMSGRLTMVADESIYMSLRVLGLEVAQVWIDTDSVFVSEKMGKTVVVESLDKLTARTGLKLGDIQALMLGQAFYPGEGTLLDASKAERLFSVTHGDDVMLMTPRRTPDGFTWYMSVAAGPVLAGVSVEPDGMKPFIAKYSEDTDTPAGKVATEVALSGTLSSKKLDATVVWNTSKAEWNKGAKPSKPNWRGYRRLGSQDMLKALQKSL